MKQKGKRIVIIGSGHVAGTLGLVLAKTNTIVEVYSRKVANAKALAIKLKCAYTTNLKKLADADIYIIAVKDDAIESVAKSMSVKGKIVLHTSGSVDIKVLKHASTQVGVMYPLYSFAVGQLLKTGVPFCVEASSSLVKKKITALVRELKGKTYFLDSKQRGQLHMIAVFANNFTNHMFTIAEDLSAKAHISKDILIPLIEGTVNKLKTQSAPEAQTGPAQREDTKTLKRHEQLLKSNKQYLKVYKAISESIIASAKNGK